MRLDIHFNFFLFLFFSGEHLFLLEINQQMLAVYIHQILPHQINYLLSITSHTLITIPCIAHQNSNPLAFITYRYLLRSNNFSF